MPNKLELYKKTFIQSPCRGIRNGYFISKLLKNT